MSKILVIFIIIFFHEFKMENSYYGSFIDMFTLLIYWSHTSVICVAQQNQQSSNYD